MTVCVENAVAAIILCGYEITEANESVASWDDRPVNIPQQISSLTDRIKRDVGYHCSTFSGQAEIIGREVARIKEDWLSNFGINERNIHECKIIQLERADLPHHLIYQLHIRDQPIDQLIIDLSIMSSQRRDIRTTPPATNQPPAESR